MMKIPQSIFDGQDLIWQFAACNNTGNIALFEYPPVPAPNGAGWYVEGETLAIRQNLFDLIKGPDQLVDDWWRGTVIERTEEATIPAGTPQWPVRHAHTPACVPQTVFNGAPDWVQWAMLKSGQLFWFEREPVTLDVRQQSCAPVPLPPLPANTVYGPTYRIRIEAPVANQGIAIPQEAFNDAPDWVNYAAYDTLSGQLFWHSKGDCSGLKQRIRGFQFPTIAPWQYFITTQRLQTSAMQVELPQDVFDQAPDWVEWVAVLQSGLIWLDRHPDVKPTGRTMVPAAWQLPEIPALEKGQIYIATKRVVPSNIKPSPEPTRTDALPDPAVTTTKRTVLNLSPELCEKLLIESILRHYPQMAGGKLSLERNGTNCVIIAEVAL